MPEIKLQFGKMDLESDPTSKDESVSAILFNAYRVAKDIHRAPGLTEFCDLGNGLKVYIYFSTLHNKCLAVTGSSLDDGTADIYEISASGVATLISYSLLTLNVRVSFAEDATRILMAARSGIHSYDVLSGDVSQLQGVGGSSPPNNVTSISIVRGFLVANGQDAGGGGIPGDFGWSNDVDYAVWNYE